jgi:hypothetical protein
MKRIAVILGIAAAIGLTPSVAAAASSAQSVKPAVLKPALLKPALVKPALVRSALVRPMPVRQIWFGARAIQFKHSL